MPLRGVPFVFRDGVVKVIEFHDLLDEGDSFGRIIVVFAKPDAGLCSAVVDASHHLDLVIPLLVVGLVYAQRIDPQDPVLVSMSEILQS